MSYNRLVDLSSFLLILRLIQLCAYNDLRCCGSCNTALGSLGGPSPTSLTALTRNWYDLAGCKSPTVYDLCSNGISLSATRHPSLGRISPEGTSRNWTTNFFIGLWPSNPGFHWTSTARLDWGLSSTEVIDGLYGNSEITAIVNILPFMSTETG